MASLLNNASLLLNPAGSIIAYEEDKIFSVLPSNGAGDFTFSGGDGGTRVNQQGYIEQTPANFMLNSGTTWTPYNVTVTTGVTDPVGGTGAYTIGSIASGNITDYGNKGTNTMSLPAGTVITFSISMKGSGTIATYLERAIAGTYWFDVKTHTLSSEWQIFTHTYTVPTDASGVGVYVGNATGTTATSVDIAFPSLNYGSTAKPYQPTTDRLNYPRITYQNGRGALLSEPQRTNLWLQSQNFSNAGATYGLFRLTLTQNAGISPDGTSNAVRWVDTATTGNHQLEPFFTAVSGQTYTVSVFVKAAERTQFHIFAFADNGVFNNTDAFYDVAAGTVISGTGASIEKWPNGWYRCIRTMTAGASGTGYWGVGPAVNGAASYVGDTNSGILVWGGQNEASSFPTSYIPTTTATVTRPADIASNTNASSLIGQSAGTVYFDFTLDNLCDGLQSDQPVLWYMKDGGTGERYVELISGNRLVYVEYNGAVIASIITSAINTGRHKCAIAYANNDMVFYVDGIQMGIDGGGTPSGFSTVSTQYYTSFYYGQCKVHSLAPYTSRLTNTQLAELTTVRSGSGGNISYYGPYTIHTFTGSATFTPSFNGQVEVLVVAGGGSGAELFGGGGAGGLIYASSIGVAQGTGYTITIGAGGASQSTYQNNGNNGSNSFAFGLTTIGGGGGGAQSVGLNGGSGGGGGDWAGFGYSGGSGIIGQGNNGGQGEPTGYDGSGGGGGGAGQVGQIGAVLQAGKGGDGLPYSISGFSTYYAGGGGGTCWQGSSTGVGTNGLGGLGGGGLGGNGTANINSIGGPAVDYTGGGGGAAVRNSSTAYASGKGGDGIVIIRYLT